MKPRLQEPTVFSSSIIRVSPNRSEVSSTYLLYFFTSPLGQNAIGQIVRHLAVSGISGGDLKAILVPIPSLAEQQQIANQLAAVDARLAAEEERRVAVATLFESLLHDLMTGRRRVKESGVA